MISSNARHRLSPALLLALSVSLSGIGCTSIGYTIEPGDKVLIKDGMTMAQVREAIGPPLDVNHYRTQPGPTWTYRIAGELETVFDVDFAPDRTVVQTSDRYSPVGGDDRPQAR